MIEPSSPFNHNAACKISEPISIGGKPPSRHSPTVSGLTELLRGSPQTGRDNIDIEANVAHDDSGILAVTVRNGIISQPHERISLVRGKARQNKDIPNSYGTLCDIESQERVRTGPKLHVRKPVVWPSESALRIFNSVVSPKTWDNGAIWSICVIEPARLLPAVVLGLLLNVLDALSYGKLVC